MALVSRAREIPPQYATSGVLAWTYLFHLQDLTRTLFRFERGPVSLIHLGNADFQLAGKRFGEGQSHDPTEAVEGSQVDGTPIVVGDASELHLVLAHDAVRRVVKPFCAVDWFATAHVWGAFGAYNVRWDT